MLDAIRGRFKARERTISQREYAAARGMGWLYDDAPSGDLHTRIAAALGWTREQAQSLSLASLRDMVRPIDAALAGEISDTIASGTHIARRS